MFLKLDKWWVYKIAGGLLTAVLVTFEFGIIINSIYWTNILLLFAAFICLAIFGHLLNDLSDVDSDSKVGKSNLVQSIGKGRSVFIMICSLICAFVLVAFIKQPLLLLLSALHVALNVSYSLRPIRLKERGFLAVLATGFYERTLPYILISVMLLHLPHVKEGSKVILLVYLLWSYTWEVRNFINGQVSDRNDDEKTGLTTLALKFSLATLRRAKWGVFILELILALIWLTSLPQFGLVAVVALLLAYYFHGRRFGSYQFDKDHTFDFVDDLYNFNFPLLITISVCLWSNINTWPLMLVILIGFDNHVRKLFFVIADKLYWFGRGQINR